MTLAVVDAIAGPDESVTVGMGEMQVVKDRPMVLTSIGLGSCIAMCAYDPVAKVAGMSHMLLPSSADGGGGKVSAKHVDKGVPLLIEEMVKRGAAKSRLVVKITGGAQMLRIPGLLPRLNVADRNIDAAKTAVAKEGIRIAAIDVGGESGRTVQMFTASGKVMVKKVGGENVEL